MGRSFANDSDETLIQSVADGTGTDATNATKMELERRMNMRLSQSIKSLREKVNWLNWAIFIATAVGALAAVALLVKK